VLIFPKKKVFVLFDALGACAGSVYGCGVVTACSTAATLVLGFKYFKLGPPEASSSGGACAGGRLVSQA
jgi:hypothetical protein